MVSLCPARPAGDPQMILQKTIESPFLARRVTPWCVAFFLCVIQASCTQDSSSSLMTPMVNEIATAPSKDSASISTPPVASGSRNHLETHQSGSDFALIIGETNDDGLSEEISACEFNVICVTTLDTGSKRMYQHSAWQTVRLIAVQDTDGDPGAEIVVVAYTREGLLACVCVIHDKANSIQFYGGQGWGSVEVQTLANTDGIDGEEILVHVKSDEGKLRCFCLIRDRDRTVREYSDVAWTTLRFRIVADTDGESGKEVIFEARDAADQLVCVCVIRDQKNELVSYTDSKWKMGEVQLFTDTDGQPGLEILVTFMNGSSSGITVIHDASRTSTIYEFEGDHTIQQVRNYDRSHGDEICVLLPIQEKYLLINDRQREQEVVESCGHVGKARDRT